MIDLKRKLKRSFDEEPEFETPPATPAKRSRRDSYTNPKSVCTVASDDSFASLKKRGRPRVIDEEDIDPSASAREKNNRASRRSRLNKANREKTLFKEAEDLQKLFDELCAEEERLDKEAQKWRRAVVRLATL